ncbi:MAG: hypothetical protein EF812_01495 [Methanosarcinales archaeon]|nr:MAG: hypothetical protein EF812_01495 [Methanosarcinales archaeon]
MLYQYLLKSILSIIIGVIFANILVETNITAKLNFLIKQMCIVSNLPDGAIVAALTYLFNSTAGKAALAELYRNKRIREDKTTTSAMLCTLPTVLGESLFRVHAPIALVFLGPALGSIYVGLNILSALVQAEAAVN